MCLSFPCMYDGEVHILCSKDSLMLGIRSLGMIMGSISCRRSLHWFSDGTSFTASVEEIVGGGENGQRVTTYEKENFNLIIVARQAIKVMSRFLYGKSKATLPAANLPMCNVTTVMWKMLQFIKQLLIIVLLQHRVLTIFQNPQAYKENMTYMTSQLKGILPYYGSPYDYPVSKKLLSMVNVYKAEAQENDISRVNVGEKIRQEVDLQCNMINKKRLRSTINRKDAPVILYL
ncbi:hypothetical protein EV363DRAFT_1293928 [Boletus edulis]|nr:hypothetical protein EV363DRAFT_1293928 [Boletus edulis]